MVVEKNWESSDTSNIIYTLYLVHLAVGITSLIGVVMAYFNKRDVPE